MFSNTLLIFALAGNVVKGGYGQQKPLADHAKGPLTPQFDALVQETMDHLHVPGLSVAVVVGNETYAKGYGISSFPHKEATPDTLYNTASTTKSFTAAAMSMLIDDSANSSNPLKWTTKISSLIREDFVLQDEYVTTRITLEDALSHRTGMPRHDLSYGRPGENIRDMVRNLRNLPMTAEIRTKYQYCNMMFVVASYIIETLTGMWLGDFLRERIWEPLNMTDTVFRVGDASEELLATPYFWNNETSRYTPEEYMQGPQESGEGAIFSNVIDYSKYLRAMIYKAPPISSAGHEALRTPRSFAGPLPGFTGEATYALGWQVGVYQGEQLISHGGAVRGFGTWMLYLPGREWGLVIMANAMPSGNQAEEILGFHLIDELLQTPAEQRQDWKAFVDRQNAQAHEFLMKGRERLFPNAPEKPLPHSLPLEAYTGTYRSVSYGTFNITLTSPSPSSPSSNNEQTLISKVLDRTSWAAILSFEHITSDYFLVHGAIPKPDGTTLEQAGDIKAEFRIGEDGKVSSAGVTLEPMMGDDMVWFEKVADLPVLPRR